MMVVSLTTICALTLAIAAMALGFGALYPQFETENAAQIPTSFGGLVFMMATIALLAAVLVVIAQPVFAYMQAHRDERTLEITAWIVGCFVLAAALCAGATAVPLWVGLRRMERFEF
jgi:ABC-2 type transport system permease protein